MNKHCIPHNDHDQEQSARKSSTLLERIIQLRANEIDIKSMGRRITTHYSIDLR